MTSTVNGNPTMTSTRTSNKASTMNRDNSKNSKKNTTNDNAGSQGLGSHRRFTPIRLLMTMMVTLVLATGCTGGAQGTFQSDRAPAADSGSSTGSGGDGQQATASLGDLPTDPYSESMTRAVVVDGGLEVFDRPDGIVLTTLAPTTTFGTTRVLLAEETVGDWVKVRLPTRPNHRVGWIRSTAVELETMDLEVVVDLETRTLFVRSGIDLLAESTVAIGSPENPTPTGTFYITDKLETPDPTGSYGPFALGLSGYSETLTEFAGGDGQIGIHGTDQPDTIGQAVSHGCLRLPNEVIADLAETLPLGTPVHIV